APSPASPATTRSTNQRRRSTNPMKASMLMTGLALPHLRLEQVTVPDDDFGPRGRPFEQLQQLSVAPPDRHGHRFVTSPGFADEDRRNALDILHGRARNRARRELLQRHFALHEQTRGPSSVFVG